MAVARARALGATLLVGSVPFADATTVFRKTSLLLNPYITQIPDGETGNRSDWISWQVEVMEAASFLTRCSSGTADRPAGARLFEPIEPHTDPARWNFGALGYSAAAVSSYAVFSRLKREGDIPKSVKFQVSLPTPLAPMTTFIAPEYYFAVESAYENRMRLEIEEILYAIPAEDLAIQWDAAIEFALLENVRQGALTNRRDLILDRLVRLTSWIPEAVDLGFHFCYGDADHKHFKEPTDCALLVDIANSLHQRSHRALQWVHMPVPSARDDAGYFEPLRALKIFPETKLYLGLIHFKDGLAGAKRRVAAARRVVNSFGLASECGFGRRPTEQVEPLLRLHAEVVQAVGISPES